MYNPPFTITPKIQNLALEVSELVGQVTLTSQDSALVLHRRMRIRTVRSSLMIEGNTLSVDAVTAILDGKRVLGPKQEIKEVQNAKRAYDLLPKLNPFSVDDLLRAHKAMMSGLVPDAGCLRSKNVGVFDGDQLIHAGTHANYVAGAVQELLSWLATTEMHPLLRACVFHYEFEFIHPFSDGNGRLGRLWHTLLMMQWHEQLAWLPVESLILDRQQLYYAAMAKSEALADGAPFVEFMLEAIRDSLRIYLAQANPEEARASRVLEYLAQNPTATVSELALHIGEPKRTIERTLAALKAEGRLTRHGSSRAGTWQVKNR